MDNTFGRMLRALRKTRRLTQEELALRARTDQTYIAKLELGVKTNPTGEMIDRLALGLNDSLFEAEALRLAAGKELLAPHWRVLSRDEMLVFLKELEKVVEELEKATVREGKAY